MQVNSTHHHLHPTNTETNKQTQSVSKNIYTVKIELRRMKFKHRNQPRRSRPLRHHHRALRTWTCRTPPHRSHFLPQPIISQLNNYFTIKYELIPMIN